MIDVEELGRQVKSIRERKKMTLDEVSYQSGIAITTLHRIEKGYGCNIDNLNRISNWIKKTA